MLLYKRGDYMKKLFTITGALTAVYMIYLFIICSSYFIFPQSDGQIYECLVDKSISSEELKNLSRKYDITTFTNEYKNNSVFNQEIEFSFFNTSSKDKIQYGLQKQLIRSNKILYKSTEKNNLRIQRFWAINNDNKNFNEFEKSMRDFNFSKNLFRDSGTNFSIIFLEENIIYFLCIVMFMIFCISIHYILRSKEIAILKLNAYNTYKISVKVLLDAIKSSFLSFTTISIIFMIYILFKDKFLVRDFIMMFLYISLCLLAVTFIASLVASVFVKKLEIIPALKNYKNNKAILILVISFKIVITIAFMFSASKFYENYLDWKVAKQGIEVVGSNDLSYIKTSSTPDENYMDKILKCISSIDKEHLYNYANPSFSLYGHQSLNDNKKNNMLDNPPVIRMSHNMLDYVKIYSTDNKLISKNEVDANKNTVLLPYNLKLNTNEILMGINDFEKAEIKYIKEGQKHYNLLIPEQVVYNAVYLLTPVENNIYYNGGRLIFDEKSNMQIDNYLTEIGADRGTISIVQLESDYNKIIDNLWLIFIDNLQFMIINILSYTLSILAVSIAYCEYRKKELAVLKINGVKPKRVILILCGINFFINIIIAVLINKIFVIFALYEIIINLIVIRNYYSKKSLSIIKGE